MLPNCSDDVVLLGKDIGWGENVFVHVAAARLRGGETAALDQVENLLPGSAFVDATVDQVD